MPFLIPNEADASFVPQAAPDSTDIAAMVAGCEGTGVATGCEVTAQGTPDMTVAVAAGAVTFKTSAVQVAAGNVTVTGADATNPRKDLVVVDDTGAKSVVAGTAAADPVKPAIPAVSVLLAEVYVPAGDTAIGSTQITDKRVMVAEQFVRKTSDTVITSDATLNNDAELNLVVGANQIWAFEVALFYRSPTTGDFQCAFAVPTGATENWGQAGLATNTSGADGQIRMEADIAGGSVAALIFGGGGGVTSGRIFGVVRTTNAGNVVFRWAQLTSDAGNTTLYTDSYILARRVA